MHAPAPPPLDVLIVGAGISGIGMAAHLARKCPDKRYAMIERRDRIGGTWDLFRYPGVRSDSDMYTLGFEFAPWGDGQSIAAGETIRSYLEDVVDRFGIRDRIRFGAKVLCADWDSGASVWSVTCEGADGATETLRGRFLFLGSGYYDHDVPHDPAIPGIETFGGRVIHPQFWPEDFEYTGKRIAVIGSGATAATVVPALAHRAAHVTLVQRTPSYYITHPSRDALAGVLQKLLPAGLAYALTRAKNTRLQDMFVRRSRRKPGDVVEYLQKQVSDQLGDAYDPADFTPPYGPWDQRVCLVPDGDLFSAIRAGSASLVTGNIAGIDAAGIRLTDGRRVDVEVIVTATGLRLATLGKIAVSLDGEPVDFAERWYYRNCMFSNVPNFAALFGYLNAAWTLRVDMVADWLCRLFRQMDAWGARVAVPHLPDDHGLTEDDPFWGFSSGYLERGRHLIPKSAPCAPWRLSMDYFADREEMRHAPIDDGVLHFARTGFAATP